MEYPSVTVCNMNPIKNSARQALDNVTSNSAQTDGSDTAADNYTTAMLNGGHFGSGSDGTSTVDSAEGTTKTSAPELHIPVNRRMRRNANIIASNCHIDMYSAIYCITKNLLHSFCLEYKYVLCTAQRSKNHKFRYAHEVAFNQHDASLMAQTLSKFFFYFSSILGPEIGKWTEDEYTSLSYQYALLSHLVY